MDYFNRSVEEVSIGLIAVVTIFCTNVIAQILLHDEDLIAVLTVRQKRLLVGEAKIHLSGWYSELTKYMLSWFGLFIGILIFRPWIVLIVVLYNYFNANCDVLLVKCNKLDWFGSVKRNTKLCYSENVFLLNVTLFVRNISMNLHQNIYQSTEEIWNAQKLLNN